MSRLGEPGYPAGNSLYPTSVGQAGDKPIGHTNEGADGNVRYKINPLTGGIEISAAGENILNKGFLLSQFPQQRIKLASFGDSWSDYGAVNNVTAQDVRIATSANTPVGISTEKFPTWLSFFSNGLIQPVFNGGLSGQTTTQIAARAVAASSMTSTSKSLIDAQTFGADVVVVTASVNDFTSLTAASSAAAIESVKTTALANMKTVVSKARSLGIYPIIHAVMPYGITPVTADQSVINAATADYNTRCEALLGSVGKMFNPRALVSAGDGGWIADYCDAVGVHPNHAGCYSRLYKPLTDMIIGIFGGQKFRNGLPKGQNMFSNAALSASAAGLATGISIASVNGTTTNTIEWVDGANAQQILWQPGNATGTDSTLIIDIIASVAGASPFVSVALNDIVGVEYDLLVDDGSGGAPNIYNIASTLRKYAGATATIFNTSPSTFAGTITTYYKEPIVGKIPAALIQIDEATSASSGQISDRLSMVSRTQSAPIRVRISNIRFVKVPATY